MGLFRKKLAEVTPEIGITTPLSSVVTTVEVVAEQRRALTAAELAPLVVRSARKLGDDARVYLIISDTVQPDGHADDWQFHVLFPTLRAEATWKFGSSEDGASSVLSSRVSPFPEPGTTEYLMAQISPQLERDQQQAWDLRLNLIAPLPDKFVDSPSVVDALVRNEPTAFAFGPIRLKARTLPIGEAVWEWAGKEVLHVPFALPDDAEAPADSSS